jgi:hypothetical protein
MLEMRTRMRSESKPRRALRAGLRLAVAISIGCAIATVPGQALEVVNPLTSFPITIDGVFSGKIEFPTADGRGILSGEWSDVDPLGFVSAENGKPIQQAPVSHPEVNVYVASVARVQRSPVENVQHIFAFRDRTTAIVPRAGAQVARIEIPFYIDGRLHERFAVVVIQAANNVMRALHDSDGDGRTDGSLSSLGIELQARFGSSPLARRPHLVIEMRCPLAIGARVRAVAGVPGDGGAAGVLLRGVPTDRSNRVRTTYIADGNVDVPRGGSDNVDRIDSESGSEESSSDVPELEELIVFRRGDANADGEADISDAIASLGCLFQGSVCPSCLDAGDANDDGAFDISDPVFVLQWLFQGGSGPPLPGPIQCGPDPTQDGLAACVYSTVVC